MNWNNWIYPLQLTLLVLTTVVVSATIIAVIVVYAVQINPLVDVHHIFAVYAFDMLFLSLLVSFLQPRRRR